MTFHILVTIAALAGIVASLAAARSGWPLFDRALLMIITLSLVFGVVGLARSVDLCSERVSDGRPCIDLGVRN